MASIRKRLWETNGQKREAWILDYFGNEQPKPKRHIETFERKKEAEARLDQIKAELRQGTHTAASASKTIGEVGDLWIQQAEIDGLERGTLKSYREHLRLHIKPLIGQKTLAQMDTAAVMVYRNQLRSQGRSPAMAKKILISLSGIFSYAVAAKLHGYNPVAGARNKRAAKQEKRQKKRVVIPTREEVRAMIAAADDMFRPLLLTAVFAGMRASETRGLSWDNVDLDGRKVTICERADAWNTIGDPKSGAGHRDVPLPPIVVNALRQWKLACPRNRETGQADLVFPNSLGKVYDQSKMVERLYDPLQVKAGVVGQDGKAKYTWHSLRHFAASQFIALGWNPKRVQTVMGHSSIQMTYDVYGHLFATDNEDQADMDVLQAQLVG